MGFLRAIILICMCVVGVHYGSAQPSTKQNKPLVLDSREDFAKAKWSPRAPKRKNISYIYKRKATGILFGNPCAIKATRRMGFEYVLQPKGVPGSPGRFNALMNNFFVNIKLTFTRSPFWKLILNERMKECRTNSGDFVG